MRLRLRCAKIIPTRPAASLAIRIGHARACQRAGCLSAEADTAGFIGTMSRDDKRVASQSAIVPHVESFRLAHDIVSSTMTKKKLRQLKHQLAQMRRSPQRADHLQKLAKALGRTLVNRGKEPTWESHEFDELYPLSIPDHGGKDLAIGTKNSILDQLEDDVCAWEIKIEDED
jgi:hypothetical protein